MRIEIREKPGAQTPWISINQMLAADERFEFQSASGKGFLLAPKHSSQLAALVYTLHEQELEFYVQGRGTMIHSQSDHSLIVSVRAFSQLIFHDQNVLEVGAGSTLFDLYQFLLERKQEVALEGNPLSSLKRSIGGVFVSGQLSGIHYFQEAFSETFLGIELVTFEGSQIKWGSHQRSCLAGPALHKLLDGVCSFPGIISKLMLKTYPIPQVRLCLTWSFRQREALEEHIQALKNFSYTWEYLDYVISGNPAEQGFVFAQISGLKGEMEAFSHACPGYPISTQQGERIRLKQFMKQQKLKAYKTSFEQELKLGEYLWCQELDRKAWWITSYTLKEEIKPLPIWKQRFLASLCLSKEA